MTKPLDQAAIQGLLKKAEEEDKQKQASQMRRKVFPTEPRTYATWFKLPTHFAECSNLECIDPRVDKEKSGKTMVAEVNGSEICRYCFLAGANKVTA